MNKINQFSSYFSSYGISSTYGFSSSSFFSSLSCLSSSLSYFFVVAFITIFYIFYLPSLALFSMKFTLAFTLSFTLSLIYLLLIKALTSIQMNNNMVMIIQITFNDHE